MYQFLVVLLRNAQKKDVGSMANEANKRHSNFLTLRPLQMMQLNKVDGKEERVIKS